MKPAHSALIILILLLFLGSPVISDRLGVEYNADDSEINLYYDLPAKPDLVYSIVIDLKVITLLSCIGLIGIVAFSRKRIRSKNNDEDIAP
ncbi:MAG: hypothetical protein QNK25_03480 [Desulfobacterales bacterium]|nr:hypothetical protein [Desulfobacterales bacterium]